MTELYMLAVPARAMDEIENIPSVVVKGEWYAQIKEHDNLVIILVHTSQPIHEIFAELDWRIPGIALEIGCYIPTLVTPPQVRS